MIALLLTVALSPGVGQNPPADGLDKSLEQEYRKLLKMEPRPETIRLAESYLASSGLLDYRRGLAILRQSRSPAGVPLLLQRLRRSLPDRWAAEEYLTTLSFLTGEDMPTLRQNPDGVDKLIREWWVPN